MKSIEHYQKLDTSFYKTHSTGDLMSRMAEDVSRVRMYTGPAIMYLVNLLATIGFSLYFMIRKDALLTLYVLAPLAGTRSYHLPGQQSHSQKKRTDTGAAEQPDDQCAGVLQRHSCD